MKIIILVFLSSILLSCAEHIELVNLNLPSQRVSVGAGPEDMHLVKHNGNAYLLVSCLERRKENADGDMWLVDLQDYKNTFVIPRQKEPQKLRLRPQGIFVHNDKHVYIVNHGLDSKGNQGVGIEGDSILYYLFDGNSLIFQQSYSSDLLVSPNDIAALADGSFYVTNGYSNNPFAFLLQDMNLKARSTVTYYNSQTNNWSTAASCLPFANGIHYFEDKILVSTSRGKNLWMYRRKPDGSLYSPRRIASNIGAADNLTQVDDHNVLLTSHQSGWNFYCHAKNKDYPSPTIVWNIEVETGKAEILYANGGGRRINAGSTAVLYKNKLYVCQVFEPYLEVVSLR